MPTKNRIRAAIIDISEGIEALGFQTSNVIGPIDREGEEIEPDEIEDDSEDVHYYLTGAGQGANFYISFELGREYAMIVYPMDILRYLGSQLSEDEIEDIIGEDLDWDDISNQEKDSLSRMAAKQIVEATNSSKFYIPAFNLSAYASTALVDYRQITNENGFPTEFQCVRGLFPYSEQLTLQYLDDRIHSVIIAGERGRRYVEYSFRINKEDKSPNEYEFEALL